MRLFLKKLLPADQLAVFCLLLLGILLATAWHQGQLNRINGLLFQAAGHLSFAEPAPAERDQSTVWLSNGKPAQAERLARLLKAASKDSAFTLFIDESVNEIWRDRLREAGIQYILLSNSQQSLDERLLLSKAVGGGYELLLRMAGSRAFLQPEDWLQDHEELVARLSSSASNRLDALLAGSDEAGNADQFYASALTLSLWSPFQSASSALSAKPKLKVRLDGLHLSAEDRRAWPLGWNGQLYFKQQLPALVDLDTLDQAALQGLENHQLVIAQNPHKERLPLLASLSAVNQYQYWYQPLWAPGISILLFLLALVLGWRLALRHPRRIVGLAIAGLLIMFVLQWLLYLNHHWLNLLAAEGMWIISLLVGFLLERKWRTQQQLRAQMNRLLKLALPDFYRERKLEKIQPILFSTVPDQALADTVFDIALQAEAGNNHGLSKKLLSWIESSGLEHPDSEQKLREMREREAAASLDATLVIGDGQPNRQQTLSDILPVKAFGRYQVEGVLGKGAMGVVYQGVDPKINRHVAIKTLSLAEYPDQDDMDIVRDRFFREAETAGNLSHANIVTIYDVGEEGELAYIAMDLLTGAPLSQFVKSGQLLPVPLLYQLMIQIADALEYAHKHQVVHRDVKPANIIYDDDIQRVTMTDFGIAYVADNSKTRTGTIMGSPYYMSPEQVMGNSVDGRSDIFSLGVTFYQLLSGHLPFDGESIATVAYHITKTKHKPVRHWNSKLPSSAVRITNKAMQKEPNSRYQTMAEFKQALINALKRDFKKAPLA